MSLDGGKPGRPPAAPHPARRTGWSSACTGRWPTRTDRGPPTSWSRRCSLTIRGRGGWGWGTDAEKYVRAALPRIELALERIVAEARLPDDADVRLTEPVSLSWRPRPAPSTTPRGTRSSPRCGRPLPGATTRRAGGSADAAADGATGPGGAGRRAVRGGCRSRGRPAWLARCSAAGRGPAGCAPDRRPVAGGSGRAVGGAPDVRPRRRPERPSDCGSTAVAIADLVLG